MLQARSHIQEELDNLNFGGEMLRQTLDWLSIINIYLGNTATMLKAFNRELENKSKTIYRVVDLGCGGGDILRTIAQRCSKSGQAVKLCGIDGNPNILDYARQKNDQTTKIEYKQANILDPQFELEPCDILISSHFVYHFTDDQLVDFLKKAKKKVSKTIIFNELHRNIIPFLSFKLLGWILPFNRMTRQDGLKAIKRSFKRSELENIMKKAGISSYTLKWKWLFRYVLVINLED